MKGGIKDNLKELKKLVNKFPNDMDLGKMIRKIGNEHKYVGFLNLSYLIPNDMELGKITRSMANKKTEKSINHFHETLKNGPSKIVPRKFLNK